MAAGLPLLGRAYLTTEVMDGPLAGGVPAVVAVATLARAALRTRDLLRLCGQLEAGRLAPGSQRGRLLNRAYDGGATPVRAGGGRT